MRSCMGTTTCLVGKWQKYFHPPWPTHTLDPKPIFLCISVFVFLFTTLNYDKSRVEGQYSVGIGGPDSKLNQHSPGMPGIMPG